MSAQNKYTSDPIKVMIVEDYKLARVGLRYSLKEFYHIQIVAEAECGEDAVALADIHRPDVVLMDLGLPGINGLEATVQIKERNSEIKVIALTSHEFEEDIRASFSAGVTAYCLKDIEPKTLAEVIQTVITGACWIHPSVTRAALNCFKKAENYGVFSFEKPKPRIYLTAREKEILVLVAKGKNNTEIAEKLIISTHTAKAHVCNILRKFEVEDRTLLAVKAVQESYI